MEDNISDDSFFYDEPDDKEKEMKAAPSIETENENNHDEFFFGCDDNDIEGLD